MSSEERVPDSDGPILRCPRCGAVGQPGDRFCEVDGATLAPTAPGEPLVVTLDACGCGARLADAVGYCSSCGHAVVSVPYGVGAAAPWLVAATDRGRRHATNQDAVGVARVAGPDGAWALAVVCDGVSSCDEAERAAACATRVALASLLAWATAPSDSPASPARDAPGQAAALRRAITAAHEAILAVAAEAGPPPEGKDPPSATIVAAVLTPTDVAAAWLGDSRAYWLDGPAARQLTIDHAWGAEEIAAGRLTAAAARAHPQARTLTRWIGPDGAGEPGLTTFPRPATGLLLLASDGLWGYTEGPGVGPVAAEVGVPADLAGLARGLVDFAVRAGGRDNIAVALADPPT